LSRRTLYPWRSNLRAEGGNPRAAVPQRAQLTYPSLRIDDYFVCAQCAGDALYPPASSEIATVQVGDALPAAPPANNPSIPTLSEWRLCMLALVLAMLGVRRLRRR
jgi:hypothetical protein